MSENKNQEPLLMDHNYDGIQEFDNSLPGWWLATFYITIVFSVFYFGYYILFSGPRLVDEFETEKTEWLAKAPPPETKVPNAEELYALLKNPEALGRGKATYEKNCVSCHGMKGEGGIGPNLTDNYWIHGGKIEMIAASVFKGVLDKGMPAWFGVIPTPELTATVAYIKTLKGSNPPNPKAPQGDPSND